MSATPAQAGAVPAPKPMGPQDGLRYAIMEYINSLVMNSTQLGEEEKESLVSRFPENERAFLFARKTRKLPQGSWKIPG